MGAGFSVFITVLTMPITGTIGTLIAKFNPGLITPMSFFIALSIYLATFIYRRFVVCVDHAGGGDPKKECRYSNDVIMYLGPILVVLLFGNLFK